jgi:predicted RNase H-like HicB family nuclease
MAPKKKTRITRKRNPAVLLRVELEKEADGRWIADIPSIPGVMKYGETRAQAIRNVQALALRVLADMLEEGELSQASVSFAVA